jgi:cysteinyl-tRNA synthetase
MARLDDFKARFEEGMDDDFNTPRAIASLFDLSREVNTLVNSGQAVAGATLEAIDDFYQTLGTDVLGIQFEGQAPGMAPQDGGDLIDGLMHMLIDMRQEAREARDWARADAIREQLAELGISLEDGPEGSRWRLNR